MRRIIILLSIAGSLAALPGCTWDTVRRSMLGSLYNQYGDGYATDRFSDFNNRYDEQVVAANEYYKTHPAPRKFY